MEIVVNHLTRMQVGFICVAGFNREEKCHIRPVIRGKRLSINLLMSRGGLFDIGSVIELGPGSPIGKAPETEDRTFDLRKTKYVRHLSGEEFWRVLQASAKTRLRDIFGSDLLCHGRGCAIDEGLGSVSLGCLIPGGKPLPRVDAYGKIRMRITDGVITADPSVTDLRLFEDDHKTPRSKLINNIRQRMNKGVRIVLSVGLARAWQKPDDDKKRHWLQINNIHLADNPVWRAG